jgi:hypothetical protein
VVANDATNVNYGNWLILSFYYLFLIILLLVYNNFIY